MELNSRGFAIVSTESHDLINQSGKIEEEITYFETPYSLLDSISPAYRNSFGQVLFQKLNNLSRD